VNVEELQKLGLIGEREVLQAKAQEMGIGFADLDRVSIQPNAILAADRELATKHRAIPVKLDMPTLYVAMEFGNMAAIDAFKARTGFRIVPVLALATEIEAAIDRYYPEA
jgi:hypothetical protein